MPRRRDPWKWPVSGLAALLMLVGLFLIPHAWIQAFFSPLGLTADPKPKRLAAVDPRWWSEGWRVRGDIENVLTDSPGSVADSSRAADMYGEHLQSEIMVPE